MGWDTTGLRAELINTHPQNSNVRAGVAVGNYSFTVTDSHMANVTGTAQIGNVSRFAIGTDSLQDSLGVIIKVAGAGWNNNACISVLPVDATHTADFEFQVWDNGNFDFGYRDLPASLLIDSPANFTLYNHGANEYYWACVKNNTLNFYSGNSADVENITGIHPNDKIGLSLDASQLVLKKNGVVVLTRPRVTSSAYKLVTVTRTYSHNSAFLINKNIVY